MPEKRKGVKMEENNEEKNEMEQKNEQVENTKRVENRSEASQTKGFGVASMVLGIISIVLFCIPYLSVPCAILAIIFAIVGMRKPGKGMAIAGLVLGIIMFVIYLLGFLGIATFFGSGAADDLVYELENALNQL